MEAIEPMHAVNRVELEGTVHGAPWLSYGHGQQGRVNFWLAVSRELAGEGFELLQCAVEPRCGEELLRLDRELRDGRAVRIVARARSIVNLDAGLLSQTPGVIFVADECGLDGEAPRSAHRVGLARPQRAQGKMAAAGDIERPDGAGDATLLPLEGAG